MCSAGPGMPAGAAFWSLCLFRARMEMVFGLGEMLHWAAGEPGKAWRSAWWEAAWGSHGPCLHSDCNQA